MSIVTSNAVFDPNFGIDAAQEGRANGLTLDSDVMLAGHKLDAETWHDAVPEDGPVFPAPEPVDGPAMFRRTVVVDVLPIHIVNGVPGNVWIDPISFAMKEVIPFSRQVRVSTVDIGFTIGTPKNTAVEHVRHVVETPAEVAAWVTRFDAKKDVRPFSFQLSWTEAE